MKTINRLLVSSGLGLLASMPLAAAAARPAAVVDIHTHIFNAHDLPLGGIMRAQGMPLSVLGPVVEFLMAGTEDYTPGQGPSIALASQEDRDTPLAIAPADKAAIRSYLGEMRVNRYRSLSTELALSDGRELEKESMDLAAAVLEAANIPPAEHAPSAGIETAVSPANALAFVALMRKDQRTIARRLRADFPDVTLFVHHLMDLERAYDDAPHTPFAGQMWRFDALAGDQALGGRFLHFTAFDPFRGDRALDMIREPQATRLRGRALGVKFYPPSGYRAAQNEIEARPSWLSPFRRAQWDSRYGKLGATNAERNKRLDELADRFFAFCATNDIPVFTHCTGFGFEAVSGYGMNCNPRYWRMVLTKYPTLRLCLGHAGGEPWWFSAGKDPDEGLSGAEKERWGFGRDVVQLCIDFKNVYTEVGYLEDVLEPGPKRDRFMARLRETMALPTKEPNVTFGQKIMYGTDWHMIYKEKNYTRYLDEFIEVFADPKLQPFAARFFAGTAAEFLKLASAANDERFSPEQRAAMKALLEKLP